MGRWIAVLEKSFSFSEISSYRFMPADTRRSEKTKKSGIRRKGKKGEKLVLTVREGLQMIHVRGRPNWWVASNGRSFGFLTGPTTQSYRRNAGVSLLTVELYESTDLAHRPSALGTSSDRQGSKEARRCGCQSPTREERKSLGNPRSRCYMGEPYRSDWRRAILAVPCSL